jgi:hypothetical protein
MRLGYHCGEQGRTQHSRSQRDLIAGEEIEGRHVCEESRNCIGLSLREGDVSHSLPQEFTARFDALRRYGKLPRGRERRDQLLTSSEIGSAILGLAPVHPNWAGHAATILSGLRPIGGADASFFGTSTLQEPTLPLETASFALPYRRPSAGLTVLGTRRCHTKSTASGLELPMVGQRPYR